MPLEFTATYENGVLKPDQPLPFGEHERVTVVVRPRISRIENSAGMIPWKGDPEVLRKIAEDPEFSLWESP